MRFKGDMLSKFKCIHSGGKSNPHKISTRPYDFCTLPVIVYRLQD